MRPCAPRDWVGNLQATLITTVILIKGRISNYSESEELLRHAYIS